MRSAGVAVGDVPLGDPGYLAPSLLGVVRADSPKFRVGVVPHYVDRCNPLIQRILEEDGVQDLNVHDSPQTFLERMAECEAVISTSLHGLIFAEALSIPNLWVKDGDKICGGTFKYEDWFSMTSHPQKSPYLLTSHDKVDTLVSQATLHECQIDTKALIEAFPRSIAFALP